MIGAIIITAIVSAIVGTYMITVNRMLRSDENWNDPTAVKPVPARKSETHPALSAVLAGA